MTHLNHYPKSSVCSFRPSVNALVGGIPMWKIRLTAVFKVEAFDIDPLAVVLAPEPVRFCC